MTTTRHLWREELVPLAALVHPDPLRPFDAGAAADRSRRSFAAGAVAGLPVPLKVARVEERAGSALYLVDGVRRVAAGAMLLQQDEAGALCVVAMVADMSAPAMRWEAARASLEHRDGHREMTTRRAFWAYIKAGLYWDDAGDFRGYEVIGAALGVGKSSVCRWLAQDFPDVAARASATAGARGGATRARAATAQGTKPTPPGRRKVTSKAPPVRQQGSPAIVVKVSVKPKAGTPAPAKPHPWRALPACGYAGDRRHSAAQQEATA